MATRLFPKGELMARHLWRENERGERDDWQLDYDHHNGPRCLACGEAFCSNCVDIDALDDCDSVIVITGQQGSN